VTEKEPTMGTLEEGIKDFVRGTGVDVVGVAGPERLDGPPSLDVEYAMPGARSIVSVAVPMDVDSIYKFLGKVTPSLHNVDQLLGNQRAYRVCEDTAGYLRSLGYRAEVVPPNNNYRRSPDHFATHPDFSHRFGAVVSGIAAQGWSGNVMTREHGAAVYLCTVVTDAVLESDPLLPPRFFIDDYCSRCRLCAKSCTACMFTETDDEEYVLLNGELHPRGKRHSIDLCNASCFGLHALNKDKTWSTWGWYWIKDWIGIKPEGSRLKLRLDLMKYGGLTGDSTPRYDLIRHTTSMLMSQEDFDTITPLDQWPTDQAEMNRMLRDDETRFFGVTGQRDPNLVTCGHCALVCGPTIKETASRFNALVNGGIVVPGPDIDTWIRCRDYAEAVEMRKKYPYRVSRFQMYRDQVASLALWTRHYFGFEPKSFFGALAYRRCLKKAVDEYRLGANPEPPGDAEEVSRSGAKVKDLP
jgi:ferredoxin